MSNPGLTLPPSLPEHIRQLVEKDILTGSLESETRVTEEQLASRYSVSRTPVREAMRYLVNQGLLVRRKQGVFVAAPTTREEVDVVYRVRRSVESFLTEQAARAITEQALDRLQHVHDQFHRELERATTDPDAEPDFAALVSLDSQFHWGIYEASGSDLTGIVTSYWGRLQRELANRIYESSPPAIYADQHKDILDALRRGDGAGARRHMQHHLKYSSEAILATFTKRKPPRARRPR